MVGKWGGGERNNLTNRQEQREKKRCEGEERERRRMERDGIGGE